MYFTVHLQLGLSNHKQVTCGGTELVPLVSQARPFPFYSTDCFQYRHAEVIGADARNEKGLTCITVLVFAKELQVIDVSVLLPAQLRRHLASCNVWVGFMNLICAHS